MDLPEELQPTGQMLVSLLGATTIALPVCRPIFPEWKGAKPDFSFRKPLLDYKGKAFFAELVILRMLTTEGWRGVWVSAYQGLHFFNDMPTTSRLRLHSTRMPRERQEVLENIWKVTGSRTSFDIFAWKNNDILFCEAKRRGKDHINDNQKRFITGALACGVKPESLLVVEWATN